MTFGLYCATVHMCSCCVYILNMLLYNNSCIKLITKSIKSFIFQDQYLHPSDQAVYRQIDMGGLGLIHVLSRCQALYIRSFLETSTITGFRWSHTNRELYLQHVLDEPPAFKVSFNAIYNNKFFDLIKVINSASLTNPNNMSLKDIYSALLDHNLLKGIDNSVIPLHIECLLPWINWNTTWKCL